MAKPSTGSQVSGRRHRRRRSPPAPAPAREFRNSTMGDDAYEPKIAVDEPEATDNAAEDDQVDATNQNVYVYDYDAARAHFNDLAAVESHLDVEQAPANTRYDQSPNTFLGYQDVYGNGTRSETTLAQPSFDNGTTLVDGSKEGDSRAVLQQEDFDDVSQKVAIASSPGSTSSDWIDERHIAKCVELDLSAVGSWVESSCPANFDQAFEDS